jgi:hypothetical protein
MVIRNANRSPLLEAFVRTGAARLIRTGHVGSAEIVISDRGMQQMLGNSSLVASDVRYREPKATAHLSRRRQAMYAVLPAVSQLLRRPLSPGVIYVCTSV